MKTRPRSGSIPPISNFVGREALKLCKTIAALVVESSGETPQRRRWTTKTKSRFALGIQVRVSYHLSYESLNPHGFRVIETARPTNNLMQTSAHLSQMCPMQRLFYRLTAYCGQSLMHVHHPRLVSGHGRPAAEYERTNTWN